MGVCLKWGLGDDGKLLFITTQRSGKTYLVCPFCSAPLIAVCGGKLKPHFRHAGKSCDRRGRKFAHFPGWNAYSEIQNPKEFQYKTLSAIGVHRKTIDNLVLEIKTTGRLNYFCRRSVKIISRFKKRPASTMRNLVVTAISAELSQRSLFF